MACFQEGKLGAAIDGFYEAAARPDLWRDVLHETSAALGARGAVMICHPAPKLGLLHSQALDELIDRFVRGGWENTRAARAFPHRQWELHSEATLFSPDELERLPFYADLLTPLGFRWFTGTTLAKFDGNAVIISVERSAHDEPFSSGELSAFDRALPHLRRASEFALRLSAARSEGLLDGFDLLDCGGALLDGFGRVIRANERVQRYIGTSLRLSHGQLASTHREANTSLQRLIGSVLQRGPAHEGAAVGAVAVPRPDGRPLIVHAAPIVGSARDIFQRAKAILMVVDPDEHLEPLAPILRQAFGLTRAEARLAAEIGQGRDLKEIASAHGVSEGTIRSQLKSIFAKTNTHRQAELTALIVRLGAPALRTGSSPRNRNLDL